jgi:hypothetical protein
LRGFDWREIERLRVFGNYNDKVVLYTDGEIGTQDASTYCSDSDAAGVLAYLTCWGRSNVDTTFYTEGWTRPEVDEDGIETGNYVIAWSHDDPENGTVLTLDQVIERAIDEGEIGEDEQIDGLLGDIAQEREEIQRRRQEERDTREFYEQSGGGW